MGTTEKIARFIVGLNFNDIPAKGVEQAKISMLDTMGTTLLGAVGPVGVIIKDFVTEMSGSNQARLIGSGIRTSVLDAALANGVMGHAEDYDDSGGFGHAGVILTPPAMAMGEYLKVAGKKILEAYAVGFEVGYRLRAGLGEVQGQGGFHATSLIGTMSAASESAKLLDLDVDKTRIALGIASSLTSGVTQNFGTYTKAFHAGHAARNGLIAAILSKKGLTADPDILEGARGFVSVYGQQQADIKRVANDIGKLLAVAEHGVTIKAWPCCAGNHESLTAILHMIDQYNISPEQVTDIEIATSGKPPGPLFRTEPRTGYEGKFSLQYNMALALIDRDVSLKSFTDEKLSRPMMKELMGKVRHVWHKDYADKPLSLQGDIRSAVVTLTLKDGRVFQEKRDFGNKRKLHGEEVYRKFEENASIGGLSARKIEHVQDLMKTLEELKDITELMDALS